ncbi:acyl-CoA dehydrogenase family protein [Nocardioides sp.]|uniref:acyl-CoA dehydrogenase family protein n=1 Tax=Nocardioides sp. TaxID=35761 RepID=UPI0039E72644
MKTSFELSTELDQYGRAIRDWAVRECRPVAREADTTHDLPERWQEILDSCPVPIGRTHRAGPDAVPSFDEGHWVMLLVQQENMAYGDVWISGAIRSSLGHLTVEAMGTDEQVEKWYEPAVDGELRAAFALTEPGFGSDTSRVATIAVRDGGTWVLNGTKMYCSYAAFADYTTVFARCDDGDGGSTVAAFVVPKGTPGFVILKENEDKLGIRSWATSLVALDSCRIPLDHRLGWTNEGAAVVKRSGRGGALAALGNNRPNISAVAIGIAQASVDVTRERLAGAQDEYEPDRWGAMMADLDAMDDALERMRSVCYRSQSLTDAGQPDRALSSAAKAYAPPTCERIVLSCMVMLGPVGASDELLLEKWYRDMKIMDIFEGTAQIHRLIVARSLMGKEAVG